MPTATRFRGAIFDIDDTLLDNSCDPVGNGLHDQARLTAVHEVGRRYQLPSLQTFTLQQNIEAFRTAPTHTLEAAVWSILQSTGLAAGPVIEPHHPLFQEIIALKHELYGTVLRAQGREVPGASRLVRRTYNAFAGRIGIGSNGSRRDIDIFLELANLQPLFANHRIISRESVTHPKPHPQTFELAFQRLGLPNHERRSVVAIEDDPRGLVSAREAGLFTAAITTRYSRLQLMALSPAPDLVIDSLIELEAFLPPEESS